MIKNLFPHHLFGNYIIEIAKLFRFNFKEFQLTPTGDILSLQVYYGTPRAAFRSWYKRFNGKLILPLLNFYGADYRRRYDKECPNIYLKITAKDHYSDYDGKVSATYPPMHFDVTYQFSLYNNSLRERDKMIHKIMQFFPRGQMSLRWYPDPENYPDIFLFMPLSLEEAITDETEIEGLDQNETRDIVRTNFILISSAVVPYDIFRIPAVTKFLVNHDITEDTEKFGRITVSQKVEDLFYSYTHISSGKTLTFSGVADIN